MDALPNAKSLEHLLKKAGGTRRDGQPGRKTQKILTFLAKQLDALEQGPRSLRQSDTLLQIESNAATMIW